MDREQLSRHLDVAQRHVVEASDRITRMHEIAAELEQDGHAAAAAMAREIVQHFEGLLRSFIEQRDRLEGEFNRMTASARKQPPAVGEEAPMTITITAFDWVPDLARGLVRDQRVRWALEETGQRYDVRYLSLGAQKEPAHRARQPFGQVPTYEEGGLVLFESGAIVLHIAEHHAGLLPKDANARARAIEWLFAALNTIEMPIWDRVFAVAFEADKDWSKARLPAVNARVRERLGELSDRLGPAEWLDGAFSAGDLMMVSVLRILRGSGIVEEYPNLAAYVARGQARPAFQRALDAQMAGFTGKPPAGWPD